MNNKNVFLNATLDALTAFVNSRPGFDFADYGDVSSYRSDSRRAMKARKNFHLMRRHVERITGDVSETIVRDAFRAYSGRITITNKGTSDNPDIVLDYCTVQYYPTEYRTAACAVLSSILWEYYRDESDTGDTMRAKFVRMFGRGIARKYFN